MHPIPGPAVDNRLVLAGIALALVDGLAEVGAVAQDLVQRAFVEGATRTESAGLRGPRLGAVTLGVPSLIRSSAEPRSRKRRKIRRTSSASAGFTTSLRLLTSYPSGGQPPIHIPLAREAANLSRMRSPITSR
jgi:hypothetical protein